MSDVVGKPVRNLSVDPGVVPVGYQTQAETTCATCAPTHSLSSDGTCGCGQANWGCQTNGQQIIDVQEYVFDGGDLDPALLMRKDGSIAGLDVTDTVAHYQTSDDKLCITPTNRVAIYAPRFGAVRKITGALAANQALPTERILGPVIPHGQQSADLARAAMLPVGPHSEENASLLDAFVDKNRGIGVEMVLPPQRIATVMAPMMNLQFLNNGILKSEELPRLRELMANAETWESLESLEVLLDDHPTLVQRDVKSVQDFHVYEPQQGKCSLRICKAASHQIAGSGDTIGFSIRFDNIGPTPIQKVVIVDSLSPRLEYIEGSQQCSLTPEPEFTFEPNDSGSMILRWELREPLAPPTPDKPHASGGVIHFRCLVR
jgi:uncharacterized repeat protein (TIGR01451 family)